MAERPWFRGDAADYQRDADAWLDFIGDYCGADRDRTKEAATLVHFITAHGGRVVTSEAIAMLAMFLKAMNDAARTGTERIAALERRVVDLESKAAAALLSYEGVR